MRVLTFIFSLVWTLPIGCAMSSPDFGQLTPEFDSRGSPLTQREAEWPKGGDWVSITLDDTGRLLPGIELWNLELWIDRECNVVRARERRNDRTVEVEVLPSSSLTRAVSIKSLDSNGHFSFERRGNEFVLWYSMQSHPTHSWFWSRT